MISTEDKKKYFEYLEKKKTEKSGNSNDKDSNQNYIFWLVDDIVNRLKSEKALNTENLQEISSDKFKDALLTAILHEAIDFTMNNPERSPDSVFENALSESQNWSEILFHLDTYSQQNPEFSYLLSKGFCLSYIKQCTDLGVNPDPAITALLYN